MRPRFPAPTKSFQNPMNMSRHSAAARALRLFLWGALSLLLGLSSAWAQSGAGTVIGTVTDANSRLALSGVRVSVAGAPQTVFTDQQGNYSLANVPAGQATLNF